MTLEKITLNIDILLNNGRVTWCTRKYPSSLGSNPTHMKIFLKIYYSVSSFGFLKRSLSGHVFHKVYGSLKHTPKETFYFFLPKILGPLENFFDFTPGNFLYPILGIARVHLVIPLISPEYVLELGLIENTTQGPSFGFQRGIDT